MSALTPTFTSTPLLPPLPRFLADLLYPGQAEANETQREIDELEATQDVHAREFGEEIIRPLRINSPLWMEGKDEVRKIVPYRPGYRPELSVRWVRDRSMDVPEAEEPKGLTSYTVEVPEPEIIPEPKIPKSELPRITVSLD